MASVSTRRGHKGLSRGVRPSSQLSHSNSRGLSRFKKEFDKENDPDIDPEAVYCPVSLEIPPVPLSLSNDMRHPLPSTQMALAEAVGVAENHMWSILKGRRNPSLVLAKRMSHFMGISLEDLYNILYGKERKVA